VSACRYCGVDPELRVIARWEVFLPLATFSQNSRGASNKGRGRIEYRNKRDSYTFLLLAEARKRGIPTEAPLAVKLRTNRKGERQVIFETRKTRPRFGARRVVLTRLYTAREHEYDRGNLIGGMKPLVDAMVIAGLLYDDSPACLDDHYKQRRHDVLSGVLVELEQLEGP